MLKTIFSQLNMDFKRRTYFLFLVLQVCLCLSPANGNPGLRLITDPPTNQASVVGNPAQFTCATNKVGITMNWYGNFIGQGFPATIISACEMNPAYVDRFDMVSGPSMPCNLVVRSAGRSVAGGFQCQEGSGFDPPASAQFVVLDSDPVCQLINAADDIVEGDVIVFSCDVTYTDNLSPVLFSWQDQGGGQFLNFSTSTGNGRSTSYANVVAEIPVVWPVTGTAYFDTPVNPPTTATNTPSYTYSWTSDELDVKYCPYNISIYVSSQPTAGDVMICNAYGNPSPDFTWFNLATGEATTGQEMRIDSAGDFHYQCRASNVIRGRPCWVDEYANGTALDARTPPPNTATVSGTNETLPCKIGNNVLSWVFTAPSTPGVTIVSQCNVVSRYTEFYTVDQSEGGCNLFIIEGDNSRAGTYTCQDVEENVWPSTAEVVVLESDPVCTTNVTGNTVANGDRVKLTCVMNFTGNLIPVVSWTTSSLDPITNGTNLTNQRSIEYSINVPVYPTTFQAFSARTYFRVPNVPSYPYIVPARNAPTYEYTWTSPTLAVLYCPQNVNIDPQPNVDGHYFIGQIVTCSAEAFPDPIFKWINLVTNEITFGPTFNVTTSGSYDFQCVASNFINGEECTTSGTVSARVIGLKYPENKAIPQAEQVRLECRLSNQRVSWLFASTDDSYPVTIVSDCQVLASQAGRYLVDKSNSSCDLIIQNVQMEDAGAYTCQEPSAPEKPRSALLTVLGSNPVGEASMADDQCLMRISCSVDYDGELAPSMSWTDSTGSPVLNVTTTVTKDQVISYLDIFVPPQVSLVEPYTCLTFFNPPEFSHLSTHVIPATNAPVYTYRWSSPTIIINETEICPILVQRNDIDGANNFYFQKSWTEFRNGFYDGDSRHYWIGLYRLNQLTAPDNCTLHFDLQNVDGEWLWAEYRHFVVGDPDSQFRLSISGYTGNAGDLMLYHDNKRFATFDYDNNGCANTYGGGFWHDNCYDAGINQGPDYNFYWFTTYPDHFYLNQSVVWLLC